MRVLFTSNPVYSHFPPVAEAVRDAGHEVAVATGPPLAERGGRAGLGRLSRRYRPSAHDYRPWRMRTGAPRP